MWNETWIQKRILGEFWVAFNLECDKYNYCNISTTLRWIEFGIQWQFWVKPHIEFNKNSDKNATKISTKTLLWVQ